MCKYNDWTKREVVSIKPDSTVVTTGI